MTDADFAKNLPSPCVGICEMNEESGFCRGCYRTIEEIAGWRTLPGDQKLALLQTLRTRKVEAGGRVRERVTRRRADAWAARWAPKPGDPSDGSA